QLSAEAAAAPAHLFRPPAAYRLRRDLNTDTPLPPEEPAGENPPDGAIVDYLLGASASGPVTLEVLDPAGHLLPPHSRPAPPPPPLRRARYPPPPFWVRPPRSLSAAPGVPRFVWALPYPPPEALAPDYPISAIVHDTPAEPLGPFVLPGEYQVKLTAGGRTFA